MSLVCWSGGADSTLVLHDLLREFKRMKDPKNVDQIHTIAVRHPQLDNNKAQLEARKKIRATLAKRGLKFKHVEVEIKCRGDFHIVQHGLVQAMLWLGVAMPYLSKDEDLYLGYIDGDCMWPHWGQLSEVFSSGSSLLDLGDTSLKTPLYGTTKAKVLNRLKKARLFRMTWTCEAPKKNGRSCGQCTSCKTQILARYELKKWPKA